MMKYKKDVSLNVKKKEKKEEDKKNREKEKRNNSATNKKGTVFSLTDGRAHV